MAQTVKIGTQLPEKLHERYAALEHGDKQHALAAGLMLYLECDEETQWLYREWAKAIGEGKADVGRPPAHLKKLLTSNPKPKRSRP